MTLVTSAEFSLQRTRLELHPRKFIFFIESHSTIEQVFYNTSCRANTDARNLKSKPVSLDPGCSFFLIAFKDIYYKSEKRATYRPGIYRKCCLFVLCLLSIALRFAVCTELSNDLNPSKLSKSVSSIKSC